jgi:hypothetical protein
MIRGGPPPQANKYLGSLTALNGKYADVFRQNFRILLVHAPDVRHSRPAPKGVPHRIDLFRAADCVDFHSPVEEIPYKSADAQARRGSLNEKAEAHPLHHAGHEKSLGLRFHGVTSRVHSFLQPGDCSKGLAGFLANPCCTIAADCIESIEAKSMLNRSNFFVSRSAPALVLTLAFAPGLLRAQDAGPMRPPESDKLPVALPSSKPELPPLPPDEIIRRFAAKEDEMVRAIKGYTFQKDVRVQELGPDRKPAGQFDVVTQLRVAPDGKMYEKMLSRQPSTLQHLDLQRGDNDLVAPAPMFPLSTAMLPKYVITYGGKEPLDELNTYYFMVKPRAVERGRAYFSGVVWVDAQDLVIVKTIGKWVTETGDVKAGDLPFTLFETYRQPVGKNLWFPAYARSDETLEAGGARIPIRIIVKWTDYAPQASAPPSETTPPAKPSENPGQP